LDLDFIRLGINNQSLVCLGVIEEKQLREGIYSRLQGINRECGFVPRKVYVNCVYVLRHRSLVCLRGVEGKQLHTTRLGSHTADFIFLQTQTDKMCKFISIFMWVAKKPPTTPKRNH